jgi:pimeloyl-ACP methyl ester carboxylesterase
MPAYGRRANVLQYEEIAIVKMLKLSDGPYLAYEEYGDPDGTTVVFSCGLAHSRLIRHPDDAVTASLGVRVIAADLPGVGGSSPQPRRRIVDWGKDIEELVDALDLGTFTVAGHSGGAPHALAVAHGLPERVGKIALASPVAPLDEPGLSKLIINGRDIVKGTMPLWDWGFKPEDISQHVDLFYGDADDILDPEMPQQLGARLPDCTTHVWSGAGHFGFIDRERWTDLLSAVV